MAAWGDKIVGHAGVMDITKSPHVYFGLDAADSVCRAAARFLRFRCATQTTGKLARVLIVRVARPSRKRRWEGLSRKCLRRRPFCRAPASHGPRNHWYPPEQANSGISARARRLHRLRGPRCGAARQVVLAATDVDLNSDGDDDFAARVAPRQATKNGWGRKMEAAG